jgi:acrylyl-CoA reductase (NADPH)
MFKALLVENPDNQYQCSLQSLENNALPQEDVLIQVQYSSLNYKDGLAISGRSPVVRRFPMVPGIDFAGIVESSRDSRFAAGQAVFTNGWGLGEKYWGGLAEKVCVPGDWLLTIPNHLTAYEVMAVGTAGYTAMLAVMALENHGLTPAGGPVLVTGANGGVGSFAIAFLSRLGYQVIASTGRVKEAAHLHQLGAAEIIDRQTLSEPGKPLAKEQWGAAIDTVGSHTLANVCAATRYGGIVAACGLAQGMDFPATVAPFILRGVTLCGIDSVMCPMEIRIRVWEKIAALLDRALVGELTTMVGMDDVIDTAHNLLAGQIKGRVVVDVAGS